MNDVRTVELVQEVMGASHLFYSTMNSVLERALTEAGEWQLSISQVKLLLLISRPGQRFKVMDVADLLGVTNAAASRSIDRLVQRGLVDRTVTPEDRRAVDLTLTPMAEALLARFTEARNREVVRLLGEFPAAEMEHAATILERMAAMATEPASEPADSVSTP